VRHGVTCGTDASPACPIRSFPVTCRQASSTRPRAGTGHRRVSDVRGASRVGFFDGPAHPGDAVRDTSSHADRGARHAGLRHHLIGERGLFGGWAQGGPDLQSSTVSPSRACPTTVSARRTTSAAAAARQKGGTSPTRRDPDMGDSVSAGVGGAVGGAPSRSRGLPGAPDHRERRRPAAGWRSHVTWAPTDDLTSPARRAPEG